MRRLPIVFLAVGFAAALLAFRRPAPPCDADNAGPVLPAGFCATLFASVPGGDGVKQGDCGSKMQPAIAFAGHWAPLQLAFVPAHSTLGADYEGGAFLAFHGSWNRAPLPQAGYRVVFIPFKNGKPVGTYTTFATGVGAPTSLRASGVAVAPDGSALYNGSDQAGKIWRVTRTSGR